MGISNCHNVEDFRKLAKKRLPDGIFWYMEGGSDDEVTLRSNTTAFDDYALVPDALVDVSNIDLSTRVLGVDMALPFYLSPSGGTRLFHHHKEAAVARAAAKAGIIYGQSTMSTSSIEEVGAASSGPKMFQIYSLKDKELTRDFVARAKAANFDALCLTVDSSISGNRERDLRTGLNFPPKIRLSTIAGFASKPRWLWNFMLNPEFTLSNIQSDALGDGMNVFELAHHLMDVSVTWDDAKIIRDLWDGPFAIKGIQSVADAKRAVDIGATAIIVSTHGGRQLDGASAMVHRIAPIRQAVGNKIEIIADSGIRRGSHVLKALALGADACSFARPYIYGLAAGGEAGVTRVVDLISAEIERDMGLLGVTKTTDITGRHVVRADGLPISQDAHP
ncbi:MAG: alpha-hydroxy acid oxidase [Henriciella sp.]|nr:alpha-hydroxy acid oxidase [Henriciella sp.]